MRITSNAFEDGGAIPLKYTTDGDNVSPPIGWAELPAGTRELALLFENITPQTQEPFVQWLLYRIPADRDHLPEGLQHKRDPEEPSEALHGVNGLGNVGYDGPLGSVGRTYRYRFRLLALDHPLEIAHGLDKASVLKAASGHVLDQADLIVSYERPR